MKRMYLGDKKDFKMAEKEVSIMKEFKDNPNFVRILDSKIEEGESCVIMKHYKRGTLFEFIEELASKNEFLEEEEVLKMTLSICNALKALHERKPVTVSRASFSNSKG